MWSTFTSMALADKSTLPSCGKRPKKFVFPSTGNAIWTEVEKWPKGTEKRCIFCRCSVEGLKAQNCFGPMNMPKTNTKNCANIVVFQNHAKKFELSPSINIRPSGYRDKFYRDEIHYRLPENVHPGKCSPIHQIASQISLIIKETLGRLGKIVDLLELVLRSEIFRISWEVQNFDR